MGLALVKQGSVERGKEALQTALKLKPDFPGAAEAKKVLAQVGS